MGRLLRSEIMRDGFRGGRVKRWDTEVHVGWLNIVTIGGFPVRGEIIWH